jgi:hypothetical protein
MGTARRLAFFLILLSATSVEAQAQTITVQGGNPIMRITGGPPIVEPMVSSSTTCTLRWKRLKDTAKIAVSTICPGQKFTLKVFAINVEDGVAAPEVTLRDGMLAVDFVTNIVRDKNKNYICTLRYTASATYAQGNSSELGGDDVHTVRYTLLEQ